MTISTAIESESARSAKYDIESIQDPETGTESESAKAAKTSASCKDIPAETDVPIPQNAGFSIMGDSISTLGGFIPQGWRCHYEGEVSIAGIKSDKDTWWGKVIMHFGGHLVANSSFSGSTVEGFGFPAGCSLERARALIGRAGEKPQIVLVFMGINDYGWGGARNQVMGMSSSRTANPEDLGGQAPVALTVDSTALTRFEEAYAAMLRNIHAVAPDAQLWCLTLSPAVSNETPHPDFMYQARGVELDQYNAAIRRCVQQEGAHLADIRAFDIDYESVDNTHPSARGMMQLATMVEAQMEGKPASPEKHPELVDAPKSARHCTKITCEGCVHSPITQNSWILSCGKTHA